MKYGSSKHFEDTWFVALDHDGETEQDKKYRLIAHHCHHSQERGDHTLFYFDKASWTKLNKKEYFIMWKLEGV